MTGAAPLAERPRQLAALVLAFWMLPVLLSAAQHGVLSRTGAGTAWLEAVARTAPGWSLWAVFTLVIIAVRRRVPPERRAWRRAVAVHLPLALAMGAVHVAVLVQANRVASEQAALWTWGEHYFRFLGNVLHLDLLIYAAILGVTHVLHEQWREAEREAQAATLRGQLAEAELRALRMQIDPHFLYNALNAGVTLVRTGDGDGAARMLTGLADLLRRSLEGGGVQEVRLDDELSFIEQYLELEQIRFGDRLDVRYTIDAHAARAWVPAMILQPLVENAVRHGVEARADTGRLVVSAHVADDLLVLEVRDNGPGVRPGDGSLRGGIGVTNTRARLARLYPGAGGFDLTNVDGGACARITIPYRREPVGVER